jgi:hypothetical protein
MNNKIYAILIDGETYEVHEKLYNYIVKLALENKALKQVNDALTSNTTQQ